MNQLHAKKRVMGPDSVKMAIRRRIRDNIHIQDQVWNLVVPPEGLKPIECKWIYKETDVDKPYPLLKARLVEKLFMANFKKLTTIRLDLP